MPPSQIPQLDKRNLSVDILHGFYHCLQQTLSTTSLTEAPFGSCTATPDSVPMLFLTAKLENYGNSSSLQRG